MFIFWGGLGPRSVRYPFRLHFRVWQSTKHMDFPSLKKLSLSILIQIIKKTLLKLLSPLLDLFNNLCPLFSLSPIIFNSFKYITSFYWIWMNKREKSQFLKYGFCKKYFDRNEPLTSWTLLSPFFSRSALIW